MSEPVKTKKRSIPKVVKDLSWNKWVGEDVAKTKCLCCGVNEIKMSSFHCGHIVAEVNGGKATMDNLKPICAACNLSMGTENLEDFKSRCGFKVAAVGAAPSQAPVKEEAVFWKPGMFTKAGLQTLPKYVKWQKGADSLQMGREMQPYGYVYNDVKDLYERS